MKPDGFPLTTLLDGQQEWSAFLLEADFDGVTVHCLGCVTGVLTVICVIGGSFREVWPRHAEFIAVMDNNNGLGLGHVCLPIGLFFEACGFSLNHVNTNVNTNHTHVVQGQIFLGKC